ncbi:MAG: DNA recombination protein RmuC [Candidatus Pacebacteria bacterium]|nr:DNA recombination protein RmuC [Candidatus Paceibacterota bacterium]MBP9840560.1 DNA recombination protein RmuC [Candidatus Paceibacterota bacterium]
MDALTLGIAVIVIVILNLAGMWYIATRKGKDDAAPSSDGMMLLQKQVQDLASTLDRKVTDSSKEMNDTMRSSLGESSRLIKEITQEITSVKEISRQTGDFAKQLQNLQDILKNPKQRGILGEYYLETVLKNVMSPEDYRIQYPFKNGEIVDAVVIVNKKLVPVDSKFSLDNYNRYIHAPEGERAALEKSFVNDLKLRITETAKYIRPEENTMDFAFMFIPSEGIYYDLLTNQVGAGEEENLLQRAFSKYKVLIVSPSTFLAYLQTVMQGLKALQIEERAAEIQKRVGELGKHIGAFDTFYNKLGASLGTTVSHFNSGYKELAKIDKDVYRIAEAKIGIEPLTLDKPSMEAEG